MQLDLTGSGRLQHEELLGDRATWSRLLARTGGPEVLDVQVLALRRSPTGDQVTVRLLLEDEPEGRGLGGFWLPFVIGPLLGLGALFGVVWGVKSATSALVEWITPLACAIGGGWITQLAWGQWWPGMAVGTAFYLHQKGGEDS